MDISTGKYTNDFLLEKLQSSSRNVTYEYVVADRDKHPIGTLDITSGVISYDSNASVMRTFKGYVKESDLMNIESVDYRLIPYMVLDIGTDLVKFPLGNFICEPIKSGKNYINEIAIAGYDNGKIGTDDKVTSRIYVPAGGIYTSYIAQILGESYDFVEIPATLKTKTYDQEWEPGTPRIDIANTLLKAINYTPVYFNESGECISKEYVFPQLRAVERQYVADKNSIIVDGVSIESNAFNMPNKFIRYTESVDSDYLISTYTNNNDDDPYSVINRGRVIVDSASVDDIASQADLDNYVRVEAINAMQSTNTIQFKTLNMPGHGYQNCLFVSCEEYGISGRYIEKAWEMELKQGGVMTHKCEKVINI